MQAIRWSDHDTYLGPITYAKTDHGWGIVLGSGDGDDYPGCRLTLFGFGRTLIIALPQWLLKPHARKVYPGAAWSAETVARLGRDYYFDYSEREYGIRYREGMLTIEYGRQTMDSSTEQSWAKLLPWTQWRHVRHSLYDLSGHHFADLPESRRMLDTWEERKAIEDACPNVSFQFLDFDGEKIDAITKIEEREWRFGTGHFKWLSLFRRPRISRSLKIEFTKETGKRKGSWKGGTVGTGIDMLPGELHAAAFKRYCAKNSMTFIQ